MIEKERHVFDAPMCCSTSVCGPGVDPGWVRCGGETLASAKCPDRETLARALGLSSTANAGGVA